MLLVEDGLRVREVTRAILEHAGYRVLAAADVSEALQVPAEHVGTIDGIITDLGLPGMAGEEVQSRVRELLGPVPALYVSDYPGTHGTHGAGIEKASLLQKPFTARALEAHVLQMLGAG